MEKSEAKELVIKAGIELVNSGLIARTWGNVSCRIDNNTFMITPSGRDYLTLTVDDIVEVKIKDLSFQGDVKPSSEKGIHAEVYKLRKNINFVIHTHQDNASVVSATGLNSIMLSKSYSELGDTIICSKYALSGTRPLIKNVARAIKVSKGNALILKNHGALCFGEDYAHTFEAAHQLETACREFINEKGGDIQIEEDHDTQNVPGKLKHWQEAFNKNQMCGCIVFNSSIDVVHFSRLGISLLPFLDDFAQIVGRKAKFSEIDEKRMSRIFKTSSAVIIKDMGALCWGKNANDAKAASMITRKNCKAYFGAFIFARPKPIKPLECAKMRHLYLKKYSKLSGGNEWN